MTHTPSTQKAIILLSGGLDSTTSLFVAKSKEYECHAVSFDYGQKQIAELEAAKRIATKHCASHHVVRLSPDTFKGSALTDTTIDIPNYETSDDIPITYVPARNTIFLSFALAYAETLGTGDIFIGINAVDYSGYPDCRPEYIKAYETMANLATKSGVEGQQLTIHTPLITLTKEEIIQLGTSLGVDYSQTISCYRADDDGRACGICDSCTFRKEGFEKAGIKDSTHYQQ